MAEQSGHYAENLPDFIQSIAPGSLPFLYESTGVETFFRDERDPAPRSRRVFSFHRPETLADWLAEPDTLRARLAALPTRPPALQRKTSAPARSTASPHLEKSFAADRPRALIQMATGAGKTYTACSFTYRLIKYAGAKRILFLVDRANLGRQAMAEFQQFVAPDTGRKFTEVYNVQHLTSQQPRSRRPRHHLHHPAPLLDPARRGTRRRPRREIRLRNRHRATTARKDVAYNPAVPIEAFDFIVTDECHRSIYGLWRQVLEYFDAFLIGLTATPSKQTIGFFNQNLVMEYNHERAVADGVNVGYDVYRIKTQVTEQGGKVEKGFYVDRRSKETRAGPLGTPRRRPRLRRQRPRPLRRRARSRSAPSSRPSGRALHRALPRPHARPQDAHLLQGRLPRRGHRPSRPRGVRQGQRLLPRRSPTKPTTPRPSATKSPRRSSRSSAPRPSSASPSPWT